MNMPPQPFLSSISPPTGEGQKRQDLSEKINLDLDLGLGNGIGSSSYSSYVVSEEEGVLEEKNNEIIIIKPEQEEQQQQQEEEKRESLLFSTLQLNQQIIIIYNLLLASHLPVFLPIWISLFSSCGPHIYKKYPCCHLSGFTPRNSKHNIMNDPEPGRCRRTDGRKWRCSQNVIVDQKYCERHMHRGRTGSRKHVESSGNVSRLDNKTSTQDDDRMQTISLVTSDIDNRISDTISDLNLSLSDSNYSVPAFGKRRGKSQDSLSVVQPPKDAFCRGNEFNKDVNNGTTNRSISSEDKCNGFENEIPRKVISRKHCPQNNRGGLVSLGFGSSPDTVLQCATDKISLTLGAENITENEGRRCRRTDGKKWQCSKNAFPNQKYCEAHMHRGTKRRVSNPESAHFASTRKARLSGPRPVCPYNVINLNSMPVSPQRSMGGNSTDSSSDATTISDENVSFWRAKSVISS